MPNYSFDQSEADTVIFSAYAVLCQSGYTGPVTIDAADTDAYVAAAILWQQLACMHCITRKQETIFCQGVINDEMVDYIV